MEKKYIYTFISNYKGGVYVHQIDANDIVSACRLWADEIAQKQDIPDLNTQKFLKNVYEDLQYLPPAALQEISNVWCFTIGTGKNFILVNIVLTARDYADAYAPAIAKAEFA